MKILSASTLPFLNLQLSEAFEKIDANGFGGVEIYYEGHHSQSAKNIINDLSVYDFETFLHAPFSDLNIASLNPRVLKESLKLIKNSIKVASEIEASVTTVHFGRYSPLGLSYPEEALKRNLESVLEIKDFASSLGVTISFENSPKGFGAMYGAFDLIEKIVTDADVEITLDIGHAHTWGEEIESIISRLNSSIAHIHLHDNTGLEDMHLGIGDGQIDFDRFFTALEKIKYKKALCLEMLFEEDLKKGLKKIEDLLRELK